MWKVSAFFIVLCALEHLWFFVLESFLWRKPLGLKTFKNSPEKAELTWQLAANQGVYNAFMSLGLWYGLFCPDMTVGHAFTFFFLMCIVVAGVVGGFTVSSRIMYMQSLPAAVALVVTFLAERNA